jgi:hypothetical protein
VTIITQLVVAYLNAQSAISEATSGRIATTLVPDEGFPAIWVGAVGGGPQSLPSASVDAVERWTVPIYCMAGRRGSELDDLPDYPVAWELAQSVAAALATLDHSHFETDSAEIVSGRILSASQSIDPDAEYARVLLSVQLTVWSKS